MSAKRFFISTIAITLTLALIFALPTVIIDPFFHYHSPIDGVSYRLSDQRYQNHGILKSYEYNAIIIGSSMTECFKTSELDELFNTKSIKVPYSGAYMKELCDSLRVGLESGNDVKYVVMGLDPRILCCDKELMAYDYYPEYLYDDNILNDVSYLFNKNVLFDYTLENIIRTANGTPTDSFDEYSNWSDLREYGREAVESSYRASTLVESATEFNDAYRRRLVENISENLLTLIRENRDTEFYFFIPPYSIMKMRTWVEGGSCDYWFDVCSEGVSLLVGEENVRIFSFYDDYELICNLDNYRDMTHYGEWVNSYILECMREGEHELFCDSYADHFDRASEYYKSYDYYAE